MIFIHHCLRCAHEWASKIEKPPRCAKCHSLLWTVPKHCLSPAEMKSMIDKAQSQLIELGNALLLEQPIEIGKVGCFLKIFEAFKLLNEALKEIGQQERVLISEHKKSNV